MRLLFLCCSLLTWAAGICLIGAAVAIGYARPNDILAFASCEYSAEIYISDARHTATFNLSQNPNALDWKPTWSPDGRHLAYQVDVDQGNVYTRNTIYILDWTAPNRRDLTPNLDYAMSPAWSPNGQYIAFTRNVATGSSPLFLIDLLTGDIREFEVATSPVYAPVWSPDGRSLAFMDYESGISEILILDIRSGETRNVSNNIPSADSDPRWSPDGKYLAFTSMRDGIAQVYTANVEGGTLRNLSHNRAIKYTGAAWSPDGYQIAAIANNQEVHLFNPAGTITDRLTFPQIPNPMYAINWSSDGAYLTLMAGDPPTQGTYLINVKNGAVSALSSAPCDLLSAVWAQ